MYTSSESFANSIINLLAFRAVSERCVVLISHDAGLGCRVGFEHHLLGRQEWQGNILP